MEPHTHPEQPTGRAELARLVQELTSASLRYSDRVGGARGMNRTDLHALQALARARMAGDVLTPSALAEALSMSPSATTAVVDRLERVGHVRRVHDDVDRRRIALEMTPSAGSEARSMFGPLAAAIHAMAEEFDDVEIAVIARFLRLATAVVEADTPNR